MIGFGTLAKIAKGGLSLEELQELLSGLGLEAEMSAVDGPGPAFEELAGLAVSPGAKLMRLRGAAKNGERIGALLVMVPCPATLKGT